MLGAKIDDVGLLPLPDKKLTKAVVKRDKMS